jgi:phosphoribosylformylglycinamidine cyclo-ligase
LPENLPRILPEGVGAKVHAKAWDRPAVFDWLQKVGGIDDFEMLRTFNCGIGMVLVMSADEATRLDLPGATWIGELVADDDGKVAFE